MLRLCRISVGSLSSIYQPPPSPFTPPIRRRELSARSGKRISHIRPPVQAEGGTRLKSVQGGRPANPPVFDEQARRAGAAPSRLRLFYDFSETSLDNYVNQKYILAQPVLPRGTIRVRHVAWRGLRWTLAASGGLRLAGRDVRGVRRNRVVLAPRPWRYAGW